MLFVSKDFVESRRPNATEDSDGNEKRSNAPSREDDVVMVASSVERRDIQDDERSKSDIDILGAAVLFAVISPLGSDLSFVVY